MIEACPLCCSIPLTQGKFALVNPVAWVQLNRRGWRAKKSRGGWYAYKPIHVNGRTRYIYMHRVIAKCPKGKITHHQNRFTLDNRNENLENLTEAEHEAISRMLRIAKTHGSH